MKQRNKSFKKQWNVLCSIFGFLVRDMRRETVRRESNYYNMKRSETTINDQKTTRKREWNECEMNRNRQETPKDELVEHNYWMIINLLFRNLLTMSSKIEWFRNEWRQKFSNVAGLGKIPRFIEILCMTYTKC